MFGVRLWLGLCTALSLAGWLLSLVHMFNFWGYVLAAVLLVTGSMWWWHVDGAPAPLPWRKRHFRVRLSGWRYLRTAYYAGWCLTLLAAILFPLSTWDTLAYRIPRVLHWLEAGTWHWINAPREWLNNRTCGYEFITAPLLAFGWSSLVWLPNLICFSLLPQLTYRCLRYLGSSRKAAYIWMWVLPMTNIFILQASGSMNDLPGFFFLLAMIVFSLRFRSTGGLADLWWSTAAMALMTGLKLTHLPLALIWLLLIATSPRPAWRLNLWKVSLVLVISAGASALPTIILNHHRYGDWSGLKGEEELQASEIQYALLGNSLSTIAQELYPPWLLNTKIFQHWIDTYLPSEIRHGLGRNFEFGFQLGVTGLPSEARSGLGLTLWLLLGWLWWARPRTPHGPAEDPVQRGGRQFVLLGGSVASLAYLARAAAMTAARLSAVHHAAVILALVTSGHRRWSAATFSPGFKWLAKVHVLLALAAVLAHPYHPLIPVATLLDVLPEKVQQIPAIAKASPMFTVVPYQLYAFDPLLPFVPQDLPELYSIIGRDDIEAPLWLRFPVRRVTNLVTDADLHLLPRRSRSVIIVSEAAVRARFGCDSLTFARRVGATISGTAMLRLANSWNPAPWHVLTIEPPDR